MPCPSCSFFRLECVLPGVPHPHQAGSNGLFSVSSLLAFYRQCFVALEEQSVLIRTALQLVAIRKKLVKERESRQLKV